MTNSVANPKNSTLSMLSVLITAILVVDVLTVGASASRDNEHYVGVQHYTVTKYDALLRKLEALEKQVGEIISTWATKIASAPPQEREILWEKADNDIYVRHGDLVREYLSVLATMCIIELRTVAERGPVKAQHVLALDKNIIDDYVFLLKVYRGNIAEIEKAYKDLVSDNSFILMTIKYMLHEKYKRVIKQVIRPVGRRVSINLSQVSTVDEVKNINSQSNVGLHSRGIGVGVSSEQLPLPGLLIYFAQVKPDIYGGYGIDDSKYIYQVNGGNNLFKIVIYDYSDYSQGIYYYILQLWFRDEDHPDPVVDAIYDKIRVRQYHRIEDVENITIYSFDHGSTWAIDFAQYNVGSGSHTYAYPTGSHGKYVRTVTSGTITIYVSNVWNHAMDIRDSNPSMMKMVVHPKIVYK